MYYHDIWPVFQCFSYYGYPDCQIDWIKNAQEITKTHLWEWLAMRQVGFPDTTRSWRVWPNWWIKFLIDSYYSPLRKHKRQETGLLEEASQRPMSLGLYFVLAPSWVCFSLLLECLELTSTSWPHAPPLSSSFSETWSQPSMTRLIWNHGPKSIFLLFDIYATCFVSVTR